MVSDAADSLAEEVMMPYPSEPLVPMGRPKATTDVYKRQVYIISIKLLYVNLILSSINSKHKKGTDLSIPSHSYIPVSYTHLYESGMTMVEIAKRNNVSERTIYRYKAYYDKLREKEE